MCCRTFPECLVIVIINISVAMLAQVISVLLVASCTCVFSVLGTRRLCVFCFSSPGCCEMSWCCPGGLLGALDDLAKVMVTAVKARRAVSRVETGSTAGVAPMKIMDLRERLQMALWEIEQVMQVER